MLKTEMSTKTRSGELLKLLAAFDRVFIVTHDNPDPDAIAAAWGLWLLVDDLLDKPARIIGGGAVVRAENREMVQLLRPPLELVDDIEIPANSATILIDCGSEAMNHILVRKGIQPVAVIDHHVPKGLVTQIPFRDVRPDVAASATIVASYLREQHVEPGVKLATGMLYAIRTETSAYETHHSDLDRQILPWLTERGEPELLAAIQNAPLAKSYFTDLILALQNAIIHGDSAVCFFPQASGAEIVGEVADMLVRAEGVRRVMCVAPVAGDLLISTRTERDAGSAVELLSSALVGLGECGGHAHRAGGKISRDSLNEMSKHGMEDELRKRWLAVCGVSDRRGTRLIAKTDVLGNL